MAEASQETGVVCEGPDPRPYRPERPAPAGSWDCHAHVFGPESRFPYVKPRLYTPPDASLDSHLAMLDALGIARGVLLQPSIYGDDNRCMLDALERSNGRLRGVVAADPRTLSDRQVEDWSSVGVCGMRFNMLTPLGPSLAQIGDIGRRLSEIGWHMSLLVDTTDRLVELEQTLRAMRCRIVIEQMGRTKAAVASTSPGFQALLRLLSDRAVWVKLSHAYHLTALGRPPYEDTAALARACIDAAPDRAVWGSDWPHAMMHGPMPNDGFLFELLDEWIGGSECRQMILVDNPNEFYGVPT